MKRNERAAFRRLMAMGVPVHEHYYSNAPFYIEADNEWACHDWYLDKHELGKSTTPGLDPEICSVLDHYGLFAEWADYGSLNVWSRNV